MRGALPTFTQPSIPGLKLKMELPFPKSTVPELRIPDFAALLKLPFFAQPDIGGLKLSFLPPVPKPPIPILGFPNIGGLPVYSVSCPLD